jgi:flavodoxin
MKKTPVILLLGLTLWLAVFFLSPVQAQPAGDKAPEAAARPADPKAAPPETAVPDPAVPVKTDRFGRSLIIYYSQTGNTEKLASLIQTLTGGELYRLETAENLPSTEKELIEVATTLRKAGTRIQIKTPVPDLAGYDYVFLGTPVWFGEVSDPIAVFLEKLDFQGKKVIAFGTSGSGPGQAYDHLTKILQNASVLEGGQIFNRRTMQSPELPAQVSEWLNSINLGL